MFIESLKLYFKIDKHILKYKYVVISIKYIAIISYERLCNNSTDYTLKEVFTILIKSTEFISKC